MGAKVRLCNTRYFVDMTVVLATRISFHINDQYTHIIIRLKDLLIPGKV